MRNPTQKPIDLHAVLNRRAAETDDENQVYVEGGYVDRALSVPMHAGVAYLARFASDCWHQLDAHQQKSIQLREARRQIAQAEIALRNLAQHGLDHDVAIALAAVGRAKELV